MELRRNSMRISSAESLSPQSNNQRKSTISTLFGEVEKSQPETAELFVDLLETLKSKNPAEYKEAFSHLKQFGALVDNPYLNDILTKFQDETFDDSNILKSLGPVEQLYSKDLINIKAADIYFNTAKRLIEGGKLYEALPFLIDATNSNPFQIKFRLNLSILYIKLKNFSQSLKHLDFVLNEDPLLVEAYWRKGDCLHYLKKYDEAIKSYYQGLKLMPTNEACIEGIKKATVGLINNPVSYIHCNEQLTKYYQQIKPKLKCKQISQQQLSIISQLMNRNILKFKQ